MPSPFQVCSARVAVAGEQQAFFAEGLDALVVAVDGAARVDDLAQHAFRRLQHHHRAVDVARLADGWVDQDAAARIEPHRLRAQQPARQVEVMRSEEHTSELQSLMRISYAVFCLKKKKKLQQSAT